MKSIIRQKINDFGFTFMDQALLATIIHILIIVGGSYLMFWLMRKLFVGKASMLAEKTKTNWDNELVDVGFFKRLALLIPIVFIYYFIDEVFGDFPSLFPLVITVFEVIITLLFAGLVITFINALTAVLSSKDRFKDKPLNSYAQLAKILMYITFGIMTFSLVSGKTPWFFLSAMGAMSAIVLLIFKDTILGFIGSMQLATNDMVRIGDWITMEKYGADGTVIDITLATIKVKNFDLTITTIPTYSLISDSFKNWRGMEESEGRRIKRAVNIKTSSIKFCDQKFLDELEGIKLVAPYVREKQQEILDDNNAQGINENDFPNGRNLTNIGIFRKYVEAYLEENKLMNLDLTCMVRQLTPTEKGLPIEIYAFSKHKEWVKYESLMADVFDHILAVIPYFGLEIFQSPTGSDFSGLKSGGAIQNRE